MLYTLGGVEEGRIYSISKTCSKKTIVPIIITPQKVPKIKQHFFSTKKKEYNQNVQKYVLKSSNQTLVTHSLKMI